jgi:acyl carrier protein
MKKIAFLNKLQEDLEIDSIELNESTILASLPEYTSLTKLGIIAFIDSNFDKRISFEELNKLTTIKSLMDFIGKENFEE